MSFSGNLFIRRAILPAAFLICLSVLPAGAQFTLPHLGNDLPIRVPGPEFGPELKARALGLGPTMDVAVEADFAYVIGQQRLLILSGVRSGKFERVGELGGLGHVRQIAVARGHAFITAREDGVFIVDVRNPRRPRLANHYDTAELATGVAVSGDVLAVSNRFAGVELIDISRLATPRLLSTVRVGEAQSVVFHGTWLYAGTWSERAVAVIDVSDPRRPAHVRSVPLQGNGDGLDVRENLLAAATGHHARSAGERATPGDSRWGHGHGIEFFDVSKGGEPRWLSGLKFPPFYRLSRDTWGVVLQGRHAFVNDTHNGFFLIDVRDPAHPRFAGYHQLPTVREGDPSPAVGLAVDAGRAFVAGADDDLHLVETPVTESTHVRANVRLRIPRAAASTGAGQLPTYQVDGSIRAVKVWRDNQLLVAAGSAGVHVVRIVDGRFERVAAYATTGFARDVAIQGDVVYVAESLGGVSRWVRQENGSLRRMGAYAVSGKSIHQITLVDGGRFAFLAVGADTLQVVSLGSDGDVKLLFEHTPPSGLFYREPFSPVSADGRRILVQWHTMGLFEFAVEGDTVKATGYRFPHAMDTECGVAPWRDGWFATSRGGFFPLSVGEVRAPTEIGRTRIENKGLPGKPVIDGSTAYISNPFLGDVSALDLSQAGNPRLISRLQLIGHPGRVCLHEGKALVPAGRQGLLLWDPANTR